MWQSGFHEACEQALYFEWRMKGAAGERASDKAQGSKLTLETRKMRVILLICEWEKQPLQYVCELESSISPKQRETICYWSHQFASRKKSH